MADTYFSDDIKQFLYLLDKYEVRYLIVGGEAVIYYGHPRVTGDIDIFFDLKKSNVEKMYDALNDFWDNDIPGINNSNELKSPGYVIQFGLAPNRINLMNSIDGVEFNSAWERKVVEHLVIEDRKIQFIT
ncbi:MAG: DUF6036 family nucleotidyltransferase [Bacteroidota bacterium]